MKKRPIRVPLVCNFMSKAQKVLVQWDINIAAEYSVFWNQNKLEKQIKAIGKVETCV